MLRYILYSLLVIGVVGCSTSSMVRTENTLPAYQENNETNTTVQNQEDLSVSLFRLNNYTDTPRAGMRAANLVEGILLTKGYRVTTHLKEKLPSMKKARRIAQEDGSHYFIYGGVSEWRYKTGIDGEPAVSMQLSLYKTEDSSLIWSATASDSDWGNASIGTTAQDLLSEMMAN